MAAPKAPQNVMDAVRQIAGLRPGATVTNAQVAAMLNAVGGQASIDRKLPQAQGLLAALSRKSPDEWKEWMQANPLGDTPNAAPAPQKPAASKATPSPAAAMSPADMRKQLIEVEEMPANVVQRMTDEEVAQNLADLAKAKAAQAGAGDGRGTGKTGRRNRTAADRAAAVAANPAAAAKPAGGRRRGGAAAVTTDGEKPANNLDKNTVDGGAKDLASLPSGELYKLAREAQIREGMTPNARITPAIEGSGVVDVSPDELNKILEGAAADAANVNPFPQAAAAAPAPGSGLTGGPPNNPSPQPAGSSPPGGSPNSPPPPTPPKDDPFFIYPGLWSKQEKMPDTSKDGIIRAFARRPHLWGTTAALGGLGYYMAQPKQQPVDMESVHKKALEDQAWLERYFGRGVRPQNDIPAGMQSNPTDTIRQSQGPR